VTNPALGTPAFTTAGTSHNVAVDFGNSKLSLIRTAVSGDRTAAVAALRRVCRKAAEEGSASELTRGAPPPAEAALLNLIAHEPPAVKLGDSTEIHELAGSIPLMVVTKKRIAPADASGQGAEVGAPQRRVIIWGIALQSGQSRWLVYALRPESSATEPSGSDPRRVPIPDGATPILAVRQSVWDSVTAFRAGDATAEQWRDYYDAWTTRNRLSRVSGWNEHNGVWSLRVTRAVNSASQYIEIQFGPDGRGSLRGLIVTGKDTAHGG
jgi:hypothetical protein